MSLYPTNNYSIFMWTLLTLSMLLPISVVANTTAEIWVHNHSLQTLRIAITHCWLPYSVEVDKRNILPGETRHAVFTVFKNLPIDHLPCALGLIGIVTPNTPAMRAVVGFSNRGSRCHHATCFGQWSAHRFFIYPQDTDKTRIYQEVYGEDTPT